MVIHSDSTGGGTVKLLEVDGFPVSIVGDCHEILVFTDCSKEESEELMREMLKVLPGMRELLFLKNQEKALLI